MPFPTTPRVIYDKNPLEQVICQVRFPTILRIDSELAGFQEKIRREYPLFRERPDNVLVVPEELKQLIPSASILEAQIGSSSKAYDFASEDELWVVSLARNFLALTARKYEHWEQFRDHLEKPLKIIIEEYSPTFFSRIGLRYQNVIRKSALGLQNVAWAELLKPFIAGVFATNESSIVGAIRESASQAVIELEEGLGQVRIQHGLVHDKREEDGEVCYLIDNDFFVDHRREITDGLTILDAFHQRSGRLFRWCITEKLHAAMGPRVIPEYH